VTLSWDGSISIGQIDGRYGSDQCVSLLSKNEQLKQDNVGRNQLYIMDQFPVHLCSAVKSWFNSKKSASQLILPPKSGDLMPVIQVAEQLVQNLNSVRVDIQDKVELWENVSAVFHDPATRAIIRNAIVNFPDILKNVFESGGNN